jgi:hypothetical protein
VLGDRLTPGLLGADGLDPDSKYAASAPTSRVLMP